MLNLKTIKRVLITAGASLFAIQLITGDLQLAVFADVTFAIAYGVATIEAKKENNQVSITGFSMLSLFWATYIFSDLQYFI